MADLLRIKCPDVSLNKNERVDCLFQDIREWLYSDALINLVEIFGGKVITVEEANTFLEATKKYAAHIAPAVSLCVLSPVVLLWLLC